MLCLCVLGGCCLCHVVSVCVRWLLTVMLQTVSCVRLCHVVCVCQVVAACVMLCLRVSCCVCLCHVVSACVMLCLPVSCCLPVCQVVALDGDGAVLMHMGSLATAGQRGPPNFRHIVFNNGTHDSVGGQPTHASCHDTFCITDIALACGYQQVGPALGAACGGSFPGGSVSLGGVFPWGECFPGGTRQCVCHS